MSHFETEERRSRSGWPSGPSRWSSFGASACFAPRFESEENAPVMEVNSRHTGGELASGGQRSRLKKTNQPIVKIGTLKMVSLEERFTFQVPECFAA